MINPDLVNTIRVGELPLEPFNLTDNIPHEIGTDLKRGTVQQLADFIATVIDVSGGVGFRAVSVSDGQTLPETTTQEFILVGKGTYFNVGGGDTIVLTEELNALVSNGTFWFVGVEIPIDVELAGITQEIREGFLTTAPSEDAIFKKFATIKNNTYINRFIADGTTNVFTLPIGAIILNVNVDRGFIREWTQVDNILTITLDLLPSGADVDVSGLTI
jgi:hypothetical protein